VLLNSRGAVIGINLGILDPSGKGSFSGVGFAIPIDSVRGLVDQILAHGRVRRPSLGITIAPEQVSTMRDIRAPLCFVWMARGHT
jgi:S1-C subfamily serine protease